MVAYRVHRLWAGLGVAFLAGNLSGLLGIGGGTFKVPALHLLCRVPIKAAAATSNFMIGVTAAASVFLYYGRGEVRPGTDLGGGPGRAGRLGAAGTMLNRRLARQSGAAPLRRAAGGGRVQMFSRVTWGG